MEENLRCYEESFNKKGDKFTMQKQIILIEMIDSNTYLSGKDIYERVKKNNIAAATIYRSLKLFNKLRITKETIINNINYYEIIKFRPKLLNIHFRCYKCNRIIDIHDKNLNLECIKSNKKVEEKNDLEVKGAEIMLIGLCSTCKEQLKNNK